MQTGAGAATSTQKNKSMEMGMGHQMHGNMGKMGADMKAMSDKLHQLLDKLKSDGANFNDPQAQAVINDDIALWEALIQHIDQMAGHHDMGGMNGMKHGSMGSSMCGSRMQDDSSAATEQKMKSKTPPAKVPKQ